MKLKLKITLLSGLILLNFSVFLNFKSTQAAEVGDLVQAENSSTLYYLASDGKRYVFPNDKTYKSWFTDFSEVEILTAGELASYPLAGNVCYRAGARLVKIMTDPKVYAVEPSCILRHIDSESRAKILYGDNWAQFIDDLPDVFFANYNIGSPINGELTDFSAITSPDEGLSKSLASKDSLISDNTPESKEEPVQPDEEKMTVSPETSSPTNQVVANGSNSVTVGEFLITGYFEDIEVTSVTVTVNSINGGGIDEIDQLYLYDGTTQVGSVVPSSNTIKINTDPGIFIPKNNSKKISLKADIRQIGTGFPAQSGRGFELSMDSDDFEARGLVSGASLLSSQKQGTFTSAKYIVHKSKPTITRLDLNSSVLFNGSAIPLYRLSLTADPKGDIGFYKSTFKISASDAVVSDLKFYEDPDNAQIDLTTDGGRKFDEAASDGSDIINLLIDSSGDGTAAGGEYRIIAAGASKIYELQANVSGTRAGSSVSVQLLSDTDFPTTRPASAVDIDADSNDNFIWSDLHFGNSSTTATQTAEWFNGYLVFNTTSFNILSR